MIDSFIIQLLGIIQHLPRQDAKQSPLPKSACEAQGVLTIHEGVVVQHHFFLKYNLILYGIFNIPRCDTVIFPICAMFFGQFFFTQIFQCPFCALAVFRLQVYVVLLYRLAAASTGQDSQVPTISIWRSCSYWPDHPVIWRFPWDFFFGCWVNEEQWWSVFFSFDVSVGLETHTRKAEVSEAWWQLAEARQATLEHVREPMKGVCWPIFWVSFREGLVRFRLW